MRKILFILFFFPLLVFSQDEKYPVFNTCKEAKMDAVKECFYSETRKQFFQEFKTPAIIENENFTGNVSAVFVVTNSGEFKLIYVNSPYKELKVEIERTFSMFPKIQPASYNNHSIEMRFTLPISFPLSGDGKTVIIEDDNKPKQDLSKVVEQTKIADSTFLEHRSQLNIPFTHTYYSRFDQSMNAIGTNSHTAAKPFVYEEVANYYDFKEEKESLKRDAEGWWTRKLWNEHLVEVQSKDYWFTIDPIFDLQVGKDTDADFSSTFNNTRGIYVQGSLGKKLSFSASVFESQGRFAQYYNQFAESLGKPGSDTEVAVIPGRGIAKRFKSNAYDYPVAEGYLSYTPSKHLNIQFGHGRNFIGDGYRSLLQSDVSSPYTFLKLNTKFWKIKYTNTWMWLRDIRPEVEEDGAFLTKYMANHYLSWNVSKRLNIGLFESVMWVDSNGRGFDINYLNPVIFYRAIEFESGQDAGNAILGASAKYKWNNKVNLYGQFILDEFSLDAIKGGNKSWKNKYGYQLGLKYYNAFKVKNLMLQAEYNQVRPYTYSHNSIVLNYAHANQPMAHLWGANFKEFILIGRYKYKRWYADAKLIFGKRGLDFNDGTDNFSYGGDIYRNDEDRPFDEGVEIGQGNETSIFHGELLAGYIINPASNLRLFTNISVRNFDPNANTAAAFSNNTVWFNLGLRTDLFNWYFDF